MLVVVGRIRRAHGIKGEVGVDVRSDEPGRRFAPGASLTCGERTLTVVSSREHSGRLLVSFREISDRTAAESLHGQVLEAQIDPGERPSDPEEFYDHQLVGLRVHAPDDSVVGPVTDILHGAGQDTLVVDAGAHEVLVPFVEAHVPVVDVDAGFMRLADVPGLLDPDDAVS